MMTVRVLQRIKEVLDKGYLMSLATVVDGGVWVSDVVYVHDDGLHIYWMSDPTTRHSEAIAKNNRVAATITVNSPGENNLGIQFEGIAEKIDGRRYDLAKKHYAKRRKPAPKEDEGVLDGDSWYMVIPKKIELIDEKLFGYKKKKFELDSNN